MAKKDKTAKLEANLWNPKQKYIVNTQPSNGMIKGSKVNRIRGEKRKRERNAALREAYRKSFGGSMKKINKWQ